MKMKLQGSLVLLVTILSNTEAANLNIKGPEGKSIEDIFSSLNTFKTNIISLISKGFMAPKKVSPPAPPENYHHIVLPHPPAHVPHDLSQAIYVTNSPHLGHHHHHGHFETHEPHPMHQSFFDPTISSPEIIPIIETNRNPEIEFVLNPVARPEIPIIDINIPSEIQFVANPIESEKVTNSLHGISEFNKEVEESLVHHGPVSFVDSERVNAGIEVSNEIDDEIIKNIPEDLWREDIDGIKKHSRKFKKVKKHKVHDHAVETSTPSDPELVIE